MAFTAMHGDRGRLDATQDDLGCGWEWAAVHRARPRVPLACPECGHGLHAKVSPAGLRFFAHDRGAPTCALAQESMEHHLAGLVILTVGDGERRRTVEDAPALTRVVDLAV